MSLSHISILVALKLIMFLQACLFVLFVCVSFLCRCQLTLLSEKEAVSEQFVNVITSLPVVNMKGHSLAQIGLHRLFFQLRSYRSSCIVRKSQIENGNALFSRVFFLLC